MMIATEKTQTRTSAIIIPRLGTVGRFTNFLTRLRGETNLLARSLACDADSSGCIKYVEIVS